MKTLEDFQEEYAHSEGVESWNRFTHRENDRYVSSAMSQVAERYMNYHVRLALDNAAEKATASYKYVDDEWGMNRTLQAFVNKDSILDLKPKEICLHGYVDEKECVICENNK